MSEYGWKRIGVSSDHLRNHEGPEATPASGFGPVRRPACLAATSAGTQRDLGNMSVLAVSTFLCRYYMLSRSICLNKFKGQESTNA
jgi:hypothetical protein